MVPRILTTLFLIVVGVAVMKWSEPLTNMFGRNDIAERYLGAGGTYTMWKIVGVIFILVSFFVLTGDFKFGTPTF